MAINKDQLVKTLDNLYSYQLDGIVWLMENKRSILGDDMGIGKTVQALVAAAVQYHTGLVICPNGVKEVWAREIDRWCPWIKYQVLDSKHKNINPDAEWIIVNYELVKVFESHQEGVPPRDSSLFWEITFRHWDVIIYDEAHNLRNRKSSAFHTAHSLTKVNPNSALYLLTGTPLMNTATEFWSYLHLIDQKTFSSYWKWVYEHFHVDRTRFSRYNVNDLRDPENLKREMAKYMLRRKKEDILDLPEKIFQDIEVVMTDRQRKAYNLMAKRMTTETGKDALNAISQLTYLREICVSDALINENIQGLPGAKLEVILEILSGTDQKVLIFSQFTKAIKGLEYELTKRNIKYAKLIGEDKVENRNIAINQFQTDPETKVFLSNTVAGGVGITLTAATIVIMLDLMWTPALNAQAVDRTHRVGQNHHVTVITLSCKDSVEDLVWGILNDKQNIFNATVPTIDPNEMIERVRKQITDKQGG